MIINLEIIMGFLLLMLSICFIKMNNQIISLLIIIEAMMLILLTFSLFFMTNLNNSAELILMLLTLAACEAALGLSVLVKLIKVHGNDQTSSLQPTLWFA